MQRAICALLFSAVVWVLMGCGPDVPASIPHTIQYDKTGIFPIPAISKGREVTRTLHAAPRHHYAICVAPDYGDADLYASFNGVSQASKNRGEWEGQGLPMRDCLIFEVEKAGTIQLRIVAVEAFKGTLYFASHPYDNVPPGFAKALIAPLDKLELTFPEYGPIGSPWGNRLRKYTPFESKQRDGFFHTGTDLAARVCTPVKASCTGKIVRSNLLDDEVPSIYGGYLILECQRGSTTLALGYDHVFPDPRRDEFKVSSSGIETLANNCPNVPDLNIKVGDEVRQGQVIGYVYRMMAEGEPPHLHFSICVGTYAKCSEQKKDPRYEKPIYYSPQRGSIPYPYFPGPMIESDPRKNIRLFRDFSLPQ